MVENGQRVSPPPIRAHLLGQVRISVGQRTIAEDTWTLRSARSLFLVLLITRGHALPRDRVLDILWPEASPELARNTLYKALHALRRVLEPALSKGRASSYIESRGGTVGILPSVDVWVDADAFETALTEPTERRNQLRNAVALYGGELLLTDLYEDWPVARREAVRRAREGAVLELAAADLAAGEPQATVAPLELLLAADPTFEAAHRALMRAYAGTGQRDRALRQYTRCRSALQEELGSEPDEETNALRSNIQAALSEPVSNQEPISARYNNLPVPPTPIVGRDRETETIQGLLWRQDVRLVTLTGPGGIGKTRLALDVAAGLIEDFARGVIFVPLATVHEPDLVLPAIAGALGVGEEPNQPLATSLQEYLRERELLLVLDNIEHVLAAAVDVGELLSSCPRLTALVTSRERLQVRGEYVHEVPPLAVPQLDRLPAISTLARYGAVALFRQYLQMLHPEFDVSAENSAVVAAICNGLEGLPLAIELAAARARFLTLQDLLDGLVSRLDLLQDGPRDLPNRQRTLRDTIAWSYDLLTPEEQTVFRRLAIFSGGCTRTAAEAVCRSPGEERPLFLGRLHSLAEKHLIRWEVTGDEPRFTMLETIREFAAERLRESSEESEIRRHHATHFLDLAEQAAHGLVGTDQLIWIDRLETEQGNVRSAVGWALEQRDDVGTRAVRVAAALWRFWWIRGLLSEGISWLERAASRCGTPPAVQAQALLAMAELIETQSDYTRAAELFNEALPVCRENGDRAGVAQALSGLGQIAQDQGDYDRAAALHQEALVLYREVGRLRDSAGVLNNLATVAYYRSDIDTATALWEEALMVVRELGDYRAAGLLLGNLGSAALMRGNLDQAFALHQENLDVARQLKDPGAIAHALGNLAEAMQVRGDGGQDPLLEEALVILQEVEDKQCEASILAYMGNSAWERGDLSHAASLYGDSLTLCHHTGDRTTIAGVALLERIAAVAHAYHRPADAARLLGAAEALRESLGAPLMPFLRPEHERRLSLLRDDLGDTNLATAHADGWGMSFDTAIVEALTICENAAAEFANRAPALYAWSGDHPVRVASSRAASK
jgi:predicted ATPase/DNA-binding SARP family transcriptional activator